ncbi:MAG: dTMP kinase, partial [Planctomycetota bacterium]
ECNARLLREPGGTPLGEAVRELLLAGDAIGARTEMLLYMAARAELYERVVLPALSAGETVLVDRSLYSTAAYQGDGLGLEQEDILAVGRQATAGRLPDRVVLLDIDPAAASARLGGRDADDGGGDTDRIESRGGAYFERVAGAYRRLAAEDPARFVVVDADGSPEDVAAAVREALSDVL